MLNQFRKIAAVKTCALACIAGLTLNTFAFARILRQLWRVPECRPRKTTRRSRLIRDVNTASPDLLASRSI